LIIKESRKQVPNYKKWKEREKPRLEVPRGLLWAGMPALSNAGMFSLGMYT